MPGRNYPDAGRFSCSLEIQLGHVPGRRNYSEEILPPISREQLTWQELSQRGKELADRPTFSRQRLLRGCLIHSSFSFFPPSDLFLPHLEEKDLLLLLTEFCQQVRIDVHVRQYLFQHGCRFQLRTFVAINSRDQILFLAPTRKTPSLPEPGAGMQACQSNYASVLFFF